EYLDVCLMLDGRGRHNGYCASALCQRPGPIFHCGDCFGYGLYCKACIIEGHHTEPLHIIEEWKNGFFQWTTLQNLGLCMQLGHQLQSSCPFRHQGHKDFVVLHINGIHSINVDFCGCDGVPAPREQLLEVGWWPSTPLKPQSAASMAVLWSFHILNLQGQIAPTDFYRALEQMMVGNGLSDVPDCLPQWMIMVREWRHIKMAKCAGRGQDPMGIEGTSQGSLSIPCHACPIPHINIPERWEDTPPEKRWLYALILSQDANFKQKAWLCSDNAKDPPLGPGWGTFVENSAYPQHIAQYTDQEEISHCVGFAALWYANSKKSKGLQVTGVRSVSCARQGMYRPNGMGDLQKGEQYIIIVIVHFSSVHRILQIHKHGLFILC
ncbi:hypothetical protein L208DRAFT_1256802, partial [Tricholoma matsutake]